MALCRSTSPRLVDAHVPFDETAHLAGRVTAREHPLDEFVVLGLGVAVLLGFEADDGQQILDLREHALLDHAADFLVGRPCGVLAFVLGPVTKRKLHDFVAEVLGVRDTGRLFDLGQFVIERGAIQQLPGIGVLVILVFDPGIGIGDVAVEQVLAVFAIGFQIGFLDFLADEFGIARREFGLDEFKIPLFGVFRHLIALDRLFEHIHQVYGIGRDLGDVVIEGFRQRLVGEAGGDAGHAFIDARRILVFLQGLGLGVGIFQLLAVIDAHLGGEIGILVLLQPRHDAELGEHFERFGGAMGIVEIAARKQLLVDRGFFRYAQAIGNGNDRDAVEKGLVVLVGLEQLPFGFVG